MSPDHFRAELSRLGLSQAAFARHWRITLRTVERWCAGDRQIPGWVAVALRYMDRDPGA